MLFRTLLSLQKAQPGFETGHVLMANLPLISDGRTPQQVAQFYQEAQRNVSELPGVESAATGMFAPWRDGRFLSFTLQFSVEGRREKAARRICGPASVLFPRATSPLWGFRLLRGAISRRRIGGEPNSWWSSARASRSRLFPGQDALNRHIMWTDPLIKYRRHQP